MGHTLGEYTEHTHRTILVYTINLTAYLRTVVENFEEQKVLDLIRRELTQATTFLCTSQSENAFILDSSKSLSTVGGRWLSVLIMCSCSLTNCIVQNLRMLMIKAPSDKTGAHGRAQIWSGRQNHSLPGIMV